MLNLLDLLAHGIELGVDPGRALVQLHQKVQGADLELGFVDLQYNKQTRQNVENTIWWR